MNSEMTTKSPLQGAVGTVSNGYNITCPLPRIGVSLRHVDKVPRGKSLEHTRLSKSSTAREFSHGKLINT